MMLLGIIFGGYYKDPFLDSLLTRGKSTLNHVSKGFIGLYRHE